MQLSKIHLEKTRFRTKFLTGKMLKVQILAILVVHHAKSMQKVKPVFDICVT